MSEVEQWLEGLQPQSGKFEFIPQSLKSFDDIRTKSIAGYAQGTYTLTDTTTKPIIVGTPVQPKALAAR